MSGYFKYGRYKNLSPDQEDDDEDYSFIYETDPSLPAFEPNYGNFKKIKLYDKWVLLEQTLTKDRKWVDRQQIFSLGVQTAFYDADVKFSPKGQSKWS